VQPASRAPQIGRTGSGVAPVQAQERGTTMSDKIEGSEGLPGQLSEHQIAALRGEAERYRSAQKQVTEALGVLWTSQLDMAISLGQVDRIIATLRRPVEFYDNCSCGGGGGPACW